MLIFLSHKGFLSLAILTNDWLNPNLILTDIDFCVPLACITDAAFTLPSCLLPILIVGTPKLGASIIPLEEFPIIKFEYLIKLRYFFAPKFSIKILLVLFLINFLIILIISRLNVSELG